MSRLSKWRNLIAFWFLGLCNNFAYVIMLSAANDILEEQTHTNHSHGHHTPADTGNKSSDILECNTISTGAILLADILPTVFIKLVSPFFIQQLNYRVKVSAVTLFALSSFLLVAFSKGVWMSVLGVICASISGGLGEVTYMSLASFFQRNVISAYSSGTGGAGLFGALSYAGMTTAGLSPRNTLLSMIVVPVIMAFSYFVVLDKPREISPGSINGEDSQNLISNQSSKKADLGLKQKLNLIVPMLMPYMIPLVMVYFAEYFINQGLMELLYFNNIWLTKAEQYRWYQADYQLGVFISRSSVNLIQINKLWSLPILQLVNMGVLLLQVFYRFIPNIWIILAIVLFEGLLGGAAYVNTFYKIAKEIPQEDREFCLGAATIGDAVGIAVAGAVAIPSHNHICSLGLKA